jgi:uncharacterized protein DUF3828
VSRLAIAYLVFAALPAAQPFGSPAELLSSLYQLYDDRPGAPDRSPFADAAAIDRYFTSRLGSLIRADQRWSAAHQEIACIDFDPVIQAQDYRVTNLKIRIEPAPSGAQSVMAAVSFDNLGTATTVYFTLVKSAAGWKIDDLASPRAASFRHYLESCSRKLPK